MRKLQEYNRDKRQQATKECHSENTDDIHMHYDNLQDDIGYTEDSDIDSDLNTLNDSDGIVGILCINSVDNYIENIF